MKRRACHVFSPFLPSKMIVNITGDQFGFLRFWGFRVLGHFWLFLAIFADFEGFVGDWGVLGVQVTYIITRGIKLVVGTFTEGV